MKKEIVFLSSLVAVVAGAQTFPQGVIKLDSTASLVPIYFQSVGGGQAPSEVFIEVLASAPGLKTYTSVDSMSEAAGKVLYADLGSGNAYYFYDGSVNVSQVAPGASADFIVRAWTGATTYDAATIKGESAVINQTTAVFNGPPNTPPENPLNFNTALTMTVVPEPTTIALLALGGAALFFRRRQ